MTRLDDIRNAAWVAARDRQVANGWDPEDPEPVDPVATQVADAINLGREIEWLTQRVNLLETQVNIMWEERAQQQRMAKTQRDPVHGWWYDLTRDYVCWDLAKLRELEDQRGTGNLYGRLISYGSFTGVSYGSFTHAARRGTLVNIDI